jgi:hypothetical protein
MYLPTSFFKKGDKMQMPTQRTTVNILLILLPLIIAFGLAYYNSAKSIIKPYQIFRQKLQGNSVIERSTPSKNRKQASMAKMPEDQILIKKGEKIITHKTGIVCTGLSRDSIEVALYLLEFDPDIPFTKTISKTEAKKGVWLGNVYCRLLKTNGYNIRFKIIETKN